jgi:hypothetical protein
MHGSLRAQHAEGLVHIGVDEEIEVGQIDLIQDHHGFSSLPPQADP